MNGFFDKEAAERKYLNDAHYQRLVDALVSLFSTGTMAYGDAFTAAELACHMESMSRLNELEERSRIAIDSPEEQNGGAA